MLQRRTIFIALRLAIITVLVSTTVYILAAAVFDNYEYIAPQNRELATLVVQAGIVALTTVGICTVLTQFQPWRLAVACACMIILAYAMPIAFGLMQPGTASEIVPPVVGWQQVHPAGYLAIIVGATVMLLAALPPAVRPVALIAGSLGIVGIGFAAYDRLAEWFPTQPWVTEVSGCYTAVNLIAYALPAWLSLVMGILSSPALLIGQTRRTKRTRG